MTLNHVLSKRTSSKTSQKYSWLYAKWTPSVLKTCPTYGLLFCWCCQVSADYLECNASPGKDCMTAVCFRTQVCQVTDGIDWWTRKRVKRKAFDERWKPGNCSRCLRVKFEEFTYRTEITRFIRFQPTWYSMPKHYIPRLQSTFTTKHVSDFHSCFCPVSKCTTVPKSHVRDLRTQRHRNT